MADYKLDEKETACLNRALARMREKGVPRAKALFEVLEYLERELDAAESELAQTQEKLLSSQAEVARPIEHKGMELTAALDAINQHGWKPLSISVTESSVEIILE